MVTIICGANSQDVDFAGRTVGEAETYLRQSLNIPAGARTILNATNVGSDHKLADNDRLEFLRESGRKG